jgi:hypothetical protein
VTTVSADDDVFIAGDQLAGQVQQAIAASLGEEFKASDDPDPVPALAVGPTHVFFHHVHHFADDAGLPLSQYRYWVRVHDSERDEQRQLAVARRVFEAARSAGWTTLLTRDLQAVIARNP